MSNKILVIYKSKTGYTEKYAQWIAEELSCDIKENKKLSLKDLAPYDTIIYGGGLYAGGINGISLIKKNYESLKDKRLIVFSVGSAAPKENILQKVWKSNFTDEQRNVINTFYCRGGLDFSKLSFGNRLVMTIMKKMLQSKKNPDEETLDMLETFSKPVNYTDKNNLAPIFELVKK